MVEVRNDGYELVDIDSVQPHPENPNVGALDAIAESMAENGFFGAILVQKSTRYILVGNHRWMTAKRQELSQIPVIWLDVDDDRARRIMLADNRTGRLGADDDALLASLLQTISDETGSLAGTGYHQADFDELLERVGRAPVLLERSHGTAVQANP